MYDKSISDFLVDNPKFNPNSLASPNKLDSLIPIEPRAPSREENPAPTVNCPVDLSATLTSTFVLLVPTISSSFISILSNIPVPLILLSLSLILDKL